MSASPEVIARIQGKLEREGATTDWIREQTGLTRREIQKLLEQLGAVKAHNNQWRMPSYERKVLSMTRMISPKPQERL